jgi:two-component system, LytTR family, sensor kinase
MVAVDADAAPEDSRRRWRRGRGGAETMATLAEARRIAAGVRGGLGGPDAVAAARVLRRLLEADAVGLGGLHGALAWSGRPPDDADGLADAVLGSDARAGARGIVALPVHARNELVGVLVVAGPVAAAAARELRALRAEISPHFVYNSLTAIASFVQSDPERARDLMLDFAEYTRHSLARHGDYTTVAGEFRAIEAYLALARAVLGERLKVQVRIAPEILPVALPYLALQPLVENAVRHGVELQGGSGLVQVSGEADGTECVIAVEDDGPGMDPEYAAAVLAGQGSPGSMGLVNVDRRLRTVFGPGYGLVIETGEGAGTRVLLRLPRFQPGVVVS